MWINTTTLGEFTLHADIRYELWKAGKEAPGVLTDEYLASVGYQVLMPVRPAYDPITQYLAPRTGALVNGVWTKNYDVLALDPAIVANNCQQLTSLTPEITAILQGAGLLAPIQARMVVNLQTSIVNATQARLDTFAQTRGYDGILSAATYASSTIPKFAAEGQACVNGRDQTWEKLYEILGEVTAVPPTRPMPTGFADIVGDLPALVWPV